jgi:hypothetical protein
VSRRLSSKSINSNRVQVSKTGETRDLKMGIAIVAIMAKIQSIGIFFFKLRNIHAGDGA